MEQLIEMGKYCSEVNVSSKSTTKTLYHHKMLKTSIDPSHPQNEPPFNQPNISKQIY